MQACPFCGWLETPAEKAEHIIVDGAHCLQCRRCKAVGPQTFDENGSVMSWNKRAGGRKPAASQTAETKHVGISALLGTRPPSKINGKTPAEYRRWYRRAYPEKYRKQHLKDEAVKADRYHESNKRAHRDECKCVECGIIYKRDDAILRGFRFLKYAGNRVICDECA